MNRQRFGSVRVERENLEEFAAQPENQANSESETEIRNGSECEEVQLRVGLWAVAAVIG
jgi:hypothetical protein